MMQKGHGRIKLAWILPSHLSTSLTNQIVGSEEETVDRIGQVYKQNENAPIAADSSKKMFACKKRDENYSRLSGLLSIPTSFSLGDIIFSIWDEIKYMQVSFSYFSLMYNADGLSLTMV